MACLALLLAASLSASAPAPGPTALSAPARLDGESAWGQAPDGRRGFGDRPDLGQVARLFRDAEGEDAEFLEDLTGLTTDVRLLIASVRVGWTQRGYLSLLKGDEEELGLCFTHWKVLASGPFDEPWNEDRALVFARLAADARAWARRKLLAEAEGELAELRAGLAILHGHASGRVQLQAGFELETVTRRTDLAAARARAIRFDLSILAEPIFAPPAYGPVVEDLVALLKQGDSASKEVLAEMIEQRQILVARMTADLQTTRLAQAAKADLAARERGRRLAIRALREVRVLMPSTQEGSAPPPQIAAMKQSDRYRRVISSGLEGLAGDPFHPDLNFFVGEGYQYIEGELYADAYYDRFLVLRGYRYYDYSTFRDRNLSADVERALFFVADWAVNGDPRVRDKDGDGQVDR